MGSDGGPAVRPFHRVALRLERSLVHWPFCVRDVRASRERANTTNAAFIGVVRGVRDVRGFGYKKNKQEKEGMSTPFFQNGCVADFEFRSAHIANTANKADGYWGSCVRGSPANLETTNMVRQAR